MLSGYLEMKVVTSARRGSLALELPTVLVAHIGDAETVADTVGCSGACVRRIVSTPGMYLKVASTPKDTDELRHEARLLRWLSERLPVPKVIEFVDQGDSAYLLMSEILGASAHEALHDDKRSVIKLLAHGLRQIHAIDIGDCPFNQGLDVKLAVAKRHVDSGTVDEDDFDAENQCRSAASIHEELVRTRPVYEDLVFTHGDYCLPNIIIADSRVSGFIDLGRGGVSDRYQDLALALRSLRYNLEYFGDKDWTVAHDALFLDAYGMSSLDAEKARYYRLLDELF